MLCDFMKNNQIQKNNNIEFEIVFNDSIIIENENNMINFRELKFYINVKNKNTKIQNDENSLNENDDQSFDANDESFNENQKFDDFITSKYTFDFDISDFDTSESKTKSNTFIVSKMQKNAFILSNNSHFKNTNTSNNIIVRRSNRTKKHQKKYYKKLNEKTLKERIAQLKIVKSAMQNVIEQTMH